MIHSTVYKVSIVFYIVEIQHIFLYLRVFPYPVPCDILMNPWNVCMYYACMYVPVCRCVYVRTYSCTYVLYRQVGNSQSPHKFHVSSFNVLLLVFIFVKQRGKIFSKPHFLSLLPFTPSSRTEYLSSLFNVTFWTITTPTYILFT